MHGIIYTLKCFLKFIQDDGCKSIEFCLSLFCLCWLIIAQIKKFKQVSTCKSHKMLLESM